MWIALVFVAWGLGFGLQGLSLELVVRLVISRVLRNDARNENITR